MDFPFFHLDLLGDRLLIGIIAVVHVIINHALAVGFIPIVVLMEYRGYKERKRNAAEGKKWDELANKMMFFAFIITTTFGAMTGVGIWFSTALVSPAAIGSLIRVFFGAWFLEWIIFVLEVVFIMIYFLTWKRSNKSEKNKLNHIRAGGALTIFSWLTMAIIVGILGFMMDSGIWAENKTLIDGFLNPIYLPQLVFRTPMAFVMAGSIAFLLTVYYIKEKSEFRSKVLRNIALWMFLWTPHVIAAGIFYYTKVPDIMLVNVPIAVATQQYQNWYNSLLYFLAVTIFVSILVSVWAAIKPKKVPKLVLFIPLLTTMLTIAAFERIREFIRKPFVIENYMYSNQIRVDELEKLQEKGVLSNTIYVKHTEVTELNKIEAGEEVFKITCSRCHTTYGVNSVVRKFENLFAVGETPLGKQKIKDYIPVMNKARYFMPPFPGNQKELDALAEYVIDLQKTPRSLEGSQTTGVSLSPLHTYTKEGGN